MKFLIDECLHISLVHVAQERSHEAYHVNWLGLSGTADWHLMTRIVEEDFTFVTNNGRDFRRLYAGQTLHAGLIIIVRQVEPSNQRRLFNTILDRLGDGRTFINEVIEIELTEDDATTIVRYALPKPSTS